MYQASVILFITCCVALLYGNKNLNKMIFDHTPKGYINAAIEMLKDMAESGLLGVAGYNGVVSLLSEAKMLLNNEQEAQVSDTTKMSEE